MVSAAACAAAASPAWAQAQERTFDIAAQPASTAIPEFARQADLQILVSEGAVRGKRTNAVRGRMPADEALRRLLAGTGLSVATNDGRTITLTAPVAAFDATADAAADEATTVDTLVIAGSYIPGAASASPVQVFNRDRIDRSGYTTTQQFIASIPQNWGGGVTETTMNGQVSQSSNGLPGEAAANLRGLGVRATLTLLDGRRLPSSGFGEYADLSTVPLGAIERVEVLTDGASALYGSDAVAGVINLVVKKDFSGVETAVDYGGVTSGGLQQGTFSQSAGFDWGSGGGMLAFTYADKSALPSADRSFTPSVAAGSDLIPATETKSLFGTVKQDLTESLSLYGTALLSNKETQTTDILFGVTSATTDQYAVFGGVKVAIAEGWDLDLSASAGRNETSTRQSGPFGVSGDYVRTSQERSINLLVNGDLMALPAGPLQIAFGAEGRHQEFRIDNRLSSTVTDLERDIWAVFAELRAPIFGPENRRPLLEELTFTLAGRYEHYSDFGETTNPKLGVRWKPTPDLLIRATGGTSFNAPTLYTNNGISQGIPFPLADPAAVSGTSVALVLLGIKPGLEPETSKTRTIGFDYRPQAVPGLSFTGAYFQTRYSGKIQSPSPNFTGMLVNASDYGGLILRNPTQQQVDAAIAGVDQFFNPFGYPSSAIEVIVDDRGQNVAVVDVKGWDFGATYQTTLAGGDFTADFNAEYIQQFEQQITPSAPAVDVVDTPYNPPAWRFRTDVSWTRGGLTLTGALNYVDDYENNLTAPAGAVDAFVTADVQVRYQTVQESGPLSGVSVSLSVQNLFDEDPPALAGSLTGYDPTNANPLGRYATLQIRKRW